MVHQKHSCIYVSFTLYGVHWEETHARNYINFDIDDSRVEYRKNNLGVEEYKIKGDIELDLETIDFVKRCK